MAQCPICLSQFDDTVRPLDGFFSFHGDGCFKFCRLANAGAAWAPPLTSGLRNGAFSRFTHDSITCTMDDPEMILFVAFLDEGNTGYSRPVAGGCTNMRSIAGKKGADIFHTKATYANVCAHGCADLRTVLRITTPGQQTKSNNSCFICVGQRACCTSALSHALL